MATPKGAGKPSPANTAGVDVILDKLDQFPNLILTEYHGMSVANVTKLRRQLREVGAGYFVAKNTLIKIALHNRKNTELDGYLFGPTAIALAGEDVVAVAKILNAFKKEAPALKIKGGYAEGRAVSAEEVEVLASLPSKEQLLGQLVSAVNGTSTKLAMALSDSMGRLVRCLDARAKQLTD